MQTSVRFSLCLLVVLLWPGLYLVAQPASAGQAQTPQQAPIASPHSGSDSSVPNVAPTAPAAPAAPGSQGTHSGNTIRSESSESAPAKVNLIQDWLHSMQDAALSRGIESELDAIKKQASAAAVPLDLIDTRLTEAAAKKIDPRVAMEALRKDYVQWEKVADLLLPLKWPPQYQKSSFYLVAGNALRNGLPETAVSAVASWARQSIFHSTNRATAALSSLAGLVDSLGPENAARLATPLVASRLAIADFSRLVGMIRQSALDPAGASRLTAELIRLLEGRARLSEIEAVVGKR